MSYIVFYRAKGSINEEATMIINMYTANNTASKYIKFKLLEIKGN